MTNHDTRTQSPYEALAAIITVPAIAYAITDLRILLTLNIVIGLLGSLFKPLAILIQTIWMRVAKVLNFIVSNVLLGLIFLLILTPIAIFFRLFNKKNLMTNGHKISFYHEVNQAFSAKDLKNPW